MTKLIFFMIARREEEIILRLLDTVKTHCDAIYISRNGSQEEIDSECKMENLVYDYCKENKISCKIDAVLWKNFGHNRSLSFSGARNFAKDLGWDLKKSYGLTLDADMELVVKDPNWKKLLKGQGMHMTQFNNGAAYNNTRILSLEKEIKCLGVTHEYWDVPVLYDHALPSKVIHIKDNDDGRCKDDKIQRDIKFLVQGLQEEPTNIRYMFYLAQSYFTIGEHRKAIPWYTKRINSGGYKSEIWFSMYHRALCYHELGNKETAITYMLEAYNYEPERFESIYHIAKWYRERGLNHVALLFAIKASEIPMPDPTCHLFIDADMAKYKIPFEVGINAFYIPKMKEIGKRASLQLYATACKNGHEFFKWQGVYLLCFYAQKLKRNAHKIDFDRSEKFEGNGLNGILGFLGNKIYFEEN